MRGVDRRRKNRWIIVQRILTDLSLSKKKDVALVWIKLPLCFLCYTYRRTERLKTVRLSPSYAWFYLFNAIINVPRVYSVCYKSTPLSTCEHSLLIVDVVSSGYLAIRLQTRLSLGNVNMCSEMSMVDQV